ncbi:MAG: amidohydrolase family protein [Planctomycetes bacterium]|nr:amidohydrolase family protein [Planctomycetota bacterium]
MRLSILAALVPILAAACLVAQGRPPLHGRRPASLAIRNVHVIKGDGTPAYGPTTVHVRDGKIADDPVADPEAEIDGSGCYLLPGLVNTHAHLQEEQAGIPIDEQYQLDLWLAAGITALRDNGSTWPRSVRLRARAEKGELPAPRIYLWRSFGPVTSTEDAARRVDSFKTAGADGIKLWSNFSYDADLLAAILKRAGELKLPCTAHIGVGSSNALTYARLGVDSIEHWYGIPDAALPGVQDFPPEFSYSNELQRFRHAGRLWREADPQRLDAVLQELVDRGVSWSPTLAVYEAARDLDRAQNLPWFRDYLHPALEKFFEPNLASHGSFFLGWTSTDEAFWRENYRIWMRALRDFATKGGVITTGEDAGYIYLLYGFGLIRELELQHEAGFHPLEVLKHATWHGAIALGKEPLFGRVRAGMAADLIVVRGNPLENLKVLYPTGAIANVGGKPVRTGGVQWTIKDGWCYHGPTLLAHAKELVAKARERRSAAESAAK